jgi:hypothetical protein
MTSQDQEDVRPDENSERKSALQEYLSLLDSASRDPQNRDVWLLRAWGVMQYIQGGAGNCQLCQQAVRLAIPITVQRFTGETFEYSCLCPTCTFQELRQSKLIIMQVGGVRVEYPHEESLS